MLMEYKCNYTTPIKTITLTADEEGLVHISLSAEDIAGNQSDISAVLRETVRQLDEYFAGKRTVFNLPLKPCGTDFQKRVWSALRDIPYGATSTYGEIAAAAGNPKASRAVGSANNRNPLPIIVPCHRVIGAKGSLTGYAGDLEMKQFLLDLERSNTL